MKRSGVRRALLACSVLVVTACAAAEEQAGHGITIGFALSTLDNPFFAAMKDGVEKAAAELGATVVVVSAGDDAAAQADQVQALTTQHVGAIIINPVDSEKAKQAADTAQAAYVPLVAVDRSIHGGQVASEVASDNVQGGALAAIELGRATNGSVAHLQGVPDASATSDRGEGFGHGLNSGGLKVTVTRTADFSRTRAIDVMTELLQAGVPIRGVFADNDEMALGVIDALGERAGRDVHVVGFDGTQEALRAIEEGTMAATVAQQPELLGRKAVEQAVRAARGEKVQQVVDVPVRVVTKHNVAAFRR
ncbi:substrate-binding domain-containing protein [Lentzea sp. BCCO 10_0798]|uniref:Substrate-binding domain-containing protein n=1 Tax=Lentzea kristufekii TaxID=3095430 RepID=A0ABU4U6D9_9PSEU|nr:substrate-binding domain-containing protein [Lentzea sp. BCCO 10_0798]MDX8055677.1 substrate-binding domain-containing protein [Lentzea sp. BCCO 10_0798]